MFLSRNKKLLLALALALALPCAQANPSGATVKHGSASFTRPNKNTLHIRNSRNAVIHWNKFNIRKGQTTKFIQPGRNSAVLNRVTGGNLSKIHGKLKSNGQVFLINQHGLLIGAGAKVNTAGFFGSTLNITDEDFLRGRLKFEGGGLGGIENRGYIHAGPGGNVVLIAPEVENGGVIEVEDGNVILAAGESIRITSLNDASIEFDVQSPEHSVINLGDIVVKQGAARLFAGNLRHSGSINATGIVKNADGSISLVAQQDIEVTAGSQLRANGERGGQIRVHSHHGDVYFEGRASARGTRGRGGRVEILGERVGLFGEARVDVSGRSGGGEALIGGDYQGLGETPTARQTQVGPHAEIRADALERGNGGRVIVWANEYTHYRGEISARGGAVGGDGGFVEVSGKQDLSYDGRVDTRAPKGDTGTLLLDPTILTILGGDGGGGGDLSGLVPNVFYTDSGGDDAVTADALEAALSNILLQATDEIIIEDQSAFGGDGIITLFDDVSITLETRNSTADGDGPGGIRFVNPADTIATATGGSITMTAGTVGTETADMTSIGTLQSAQAISLSAADDIFIDGALSAGTTIDLLADDYLVVNADIIAGGNITLNGDTNGLVDSIDGIDFGSSINIRSTGGSIDLEKLVSILSAPTSTQT